MSVTDLTNINKRLDAIQSTLLNVVQILECIVETNHGRCLHVLKKNVSTLIVNDNDDDDDEYYEDDDNKVYEAKPTTLGKRGSTKKKNTRNTDMLVKRSYEKLLSRIRYNHK